MSALTIEQLSSKLHSYLDKEQVELVERAYEFAAVAHEGQTRRSGEPYITHPLAVANILADMHMDHQSLAAAMLHDVIEDTGVSKEALGEEFGEDVGELVDGVSKLAQIKFRNQAEKQAENFQKMALAMARDLRVILVKLADRLHNMRTLGVLNQQKRERIAKETLEIYAPIANRLGMNDIRVELEDLGFSTLYPMRARRIQAAVDAVRGHRYKLVDDVKQQLEERLKRDNINASIIGRKKHLYSIYQKMRGKSVSFNEIMDVFGFRVVVDSVDDCYRALGAVHNFYKPRQGMFKDYIAIPKANGYQSLHTALFGMHGVPIEIQIRTAEMEQMANAGIAAHWLYKSKNQDSSHVNHQRARQWVQGLLELQESAGNSLEFIENVKVDLFPEEVYVFTPTGDIRVLPVGATPVDLAYAVHSDIGNRCVGARINRRLSPLSQPLESGQTVEIITSSHSKPDPAWLDFVATSRARAQIRNYLKNLRTEECIELGKRLLAKALVALGSSAQEIEEDFKAQYLEKYQIESIDKAFEEIGLGDRIPHIVARQLLNIEPVERQDAIDLNKTHKPLAIVGTEGMMVNYARCCGPIPGDNIAGHITAGRGIVVHTTDCSNHREFELEDKEGRSMPLRWHDTVEGEYRVELKVEVEQQRGIIAQLANQVTAAEANTESIKVEERDAATSIIHIFLLVHDRVHLARVIKKLRTLKQVSQVERVQL